MTENSLISLYCIVDDFIQMFIETSTGKKNEALYYGKRGLKRRMPIADVVTLNLVRIFDRIADVKTFHKNAQEHYRHYFPTLTNYRNFLKATNKTIGFIAAFLHYQLYLNQIHCKDTIFYLDSTPISVCENRYICSHKVMKDIARRGKSTKGWFFGFKLHGVCTEDGTLVKICFRAGSEHDSKAFDSATKGLEGIFVTDAGYLLKIEELEKLDLKLEDMEDRENFDFGDMKTFFCEEEDIRNIFQNEELENNINFLSKNNQLDRGDLKNIKLTECLWACKVLTQKLLNFLNAHTQFLMLKKPLDY